MALVGASPWDLQPQPPWLVVRAAAAAAAAVEVRVQVEAPVVHRVAVSAPPPTHVVFEDAADLASSVCGCGRVCGCLQIGIVARVHSCECLPLSVGIPPSPVRGLAAGAAGGLYTDASFPPGRSSLCHDWATCPSPSVWSKLVWRRASEFCDGGAPLVFSDGISPDDIEQVSVRSWWWPVLSPPRVGIARVFGRYRWVPSLWRLCAQRFRAADMPSALVWVVGAVCAQGILGDCYFLSALSTLAEDPRRVEAIFPPPDADTARGT